MLLGLNKWTLTSLLLAVILIGTFPWKTEARSGPPDDGLWVEVEPLFLIEAPGTRLGTLLVPYRERRPRWNWTFSLGISSFHPEYYDPDQIEVNFETLYGQEPQVSPEIQMSYKRNTAIGSLGLDLGVSYYHVRADKELDLGGGPIFLDSTLTLVKARVGLTFTLDSFFPEPYLAPYVSGGFYSIYYREAQGEVSFNGTTQATGYFGGGLLIQLDWMDPITAREAYFGSGINNSFIFLEGRKLMASIAEKDPDFETEPFWLAGLRLEF